MNPLGLASTTDAFGVTTYTCSPCANAICVNCRSNATICLQCNSTIAGVGLTGGQCLSCADTHCLNFTSNTAICTKCTDGYGIDEAGVGFCVLCNTFYRRCTKCWYDVTFC